MVGLCSELALVPVHFLRISSTGQSLVGGVGCGIAMDDQAEYGLKSGDDSAEDNCLGC